MPTNLFPHPSPLRSTVLATALALLPAAAHAELQQIDHHRMLGIDRDTAELRGFSFWETDRQSIGVIRDASDRPMVGIEAAAYFPGFTNLYALWQDPADLKNKLVYVKVHDASATVVFDDLEGGKFAGATAYHSDATPHTVFAVQHEKLKPPALITGRININPNNASDNQFELDIDGGTIDRGDLHEQAEITADGTLYEGFASRVRIRPKGGGTQNDVLLDGQPMTLSNSNTYTFAGEMTVRVYNEHVKQGKAMGQWVLEIADGTARLDGEVEVLSPHRLAIVGAADGSVTEVMALSRAYGGLATDDGVRFYTHAEGVAYLIDTAAGTETALRSLGDHASDLEFVGGQLRVYQTGFGTLHHLPRGEETAEAQRSVGLGDLGTIMFHGRGFGPTTALFD